MELSKINILLLGANGFIGSAILNVLSNNKEFNISCVTRHRTNFDIYSNVNWVQLDLFSNKNRLQELINVSDIIINTIGELNNPVLMARTNFELVREVVDFMLSSKDKKRLIQMSSVGCYGAIKRFKGQKITINEEESDYPIGLYEETKTEADTYIKKSFAGSEFCSYTILRPTNVFGPRMKSKAIFSLASIVKSRLFFYISDRYAVSTFVHVEDVAQAVGCVCNQLELSSNQTYIVSDDCLQQVFIEALAYSLKINKPIMVLPLGVVKLAIFFCQKISSNFPLSENKVRSLTSKIAFSNRKLVELGYKPEFSIYNSEVMDSILKSWSLK